jgi:putative flippase GtrA
MKREKEFTVFTIMSVGGMALNEWLMYTGVDIFQYDYRLVKILSTFLVTIVNFTSRKVVFDRREQEC